MGKREENSKFMKDLEGNTGDISVLGGILVKGKRISTTERPNILNISLITTININFE